jgi:lipopolysaccharide export system protein LptA
MLDPAIMPAHVTVRRLRLILLAAIAVTAAVSGATYVVRTRRAASAKPATPPKIPAAVLQSAQGFAISRTEGGRTLFKATARKAVDYRETGKSELEEVEIVIFGKSGDRRDRITSKKCEYDQKSQRLYADGEVEIELASLPGQLPRQAPPVAQATEGGPVTVRTSGLLFDQKSGIASTDRDLTFRFRHGEGRARGAVYDSQEQTLWLKAAVEVQVLSDAGPPLAVRAAELRYLQSASQVHLTQPELQREGQSVRGDEAVIYLDEHHQAQSAVVTGHASGADQAAERHSEFQADRLDLTVVTDAQGRQAVSAAAATGNVRVASRSASGRVEGFTARLDLTFRGPEGALSSAHWNGGSKLVFHPPPGRPQAQVRTITAEQMEMVMRPGGRDLEAARTLTPGRLEMTGGGEPKRTLTANQLWMGFGEQNRARQLRADGRVRTEQEPANPRESRRTTSSDALVAVFSDQNQQIETVEQTGNFEYGEGPRQARAQRAFYWAPGGSTELSGGAPKVWDPQGQLSARKIVLLEKTGEALAEQEVRATQFSSAAEKSPALLAGQDSDGAPIHAVAERVRWDRRNGRTFYEAAPRSRVRMWQGPNVLEARSVAMERDGKRLTASGEVFTFLVEEGRQPLRVEAGSLLYSDEELKARYEGRVLLRSDDLTLQAAALDAFLLPAASAPPGKSRLDRAVATGAVKFRQPPRPAANGKPAVAARDGEAERMDYSAREEKVVLRGGSPVFRDAERGVTTGRELTYYLADDRMAVVGDDTMRAHSQHRVSKKPR